ncbi:YpmA family protein [Caldibacillus debilis]|uniref:DUF4264 domain-containing protein n=2 Tax=Caldibacillus debilis TaxID=301148 RepID=A0A420VER6_9BACI|nr:YpmA family protein [Caldibacillus debilis]KYD12111.1 hypothetical protein B4135_3141 [Caldibacillus debilis]RKO62162.1 Protein of unknown function (DUF4264) [Caldibacillus debilis GB1]
MREEKEKIQRLATVKVKYSEEMYKIVDLLNRTLKRDDYMFGLALDKEDPTKAIFSIYKT